MTIPAVSSVMTPQPCTIERTATLADAHQVMRGHEVRHLPVLDRGQLCGIVTQRDLHLLETLADADPETTRVEEAMHDRPFAVTGDMPLDEVLQTMATHKYGSAIVVGQDGVEGIFTTIDACQAFAAMLQGQRMST